MNIIGSVEPVLTISDGDDGLVVGIIFAFEALVILMVVVVLGAMVVVVLGAVVDDGATKASSYNESGIIFDEEELSELEI